MNFRFLLAVFPLLAALTCMSETQAPARFAASTSPAVLWSRYVGGSSEDQVRDAVTDAQGNVYVVGGTASANFTTTVGAWDRIHDNSPNPGTKPYDAFVQKYAPSGVLLASTFVGGPQYDRAYAVELAPDGSVVIGGRGGKGLPKTAGTVGQTFSGGVGSYGAQDGFVCKLSADLSQLNWCTYIGTADIGIVRDVAVDGQGNIWATGNDSLPFPAVWTAGGAQATKRSGYDGFVFRLTPDAQSIRGTYIAGNGMADGSGPSVRIDPAGTPWVMMNTNSTDLPIVGGFQATYGGGGDTYLTHFSQDCSQILFSTYIGGSRSDATETHTLAINPLTGDVYVTGGTSSPNFPVKNALQPTLAGTGDMFVGRFTNQGTLVSLTYVGGPTGEFGQGIVTDAAGQVVIAGTNAANYTTTPLHGTTGGEDATAFVLSADLQSVLFAQTVAGSASDQGRAMAVAAGQLYLGGLTKSTNFPFSLGTNPGDTNNGYLTAIRYP